MFVKPRRLAAGAAALAPVISVGTAAHAADPPPPVKNVCVGNAISAAEYAAGVRSALVCFATKAEADAAMAGTNGPVTSVFGQGFPMATFYQSRAMDPMTSLTVYGEACTDYLYLTPDAWQKYMVAWAPQRCPTAKHYTGSNFTGQSTYTSGAGAYFDAPFLRNIRSIKFG